MLAGPGALLCTRDTVFATFPRTPRMNTTEFARFSTGSTILSVALSGAAMGTGREIFVAESATPPVASLTVAINQAFVAQIHTNRMPAWYLASTNIPAFKVLGRLPAFHFNDVTAVGKCSGDANQAFWLRLGKILSFPTLKSGKTVAAW